MRSVLVFSLMLGCQTDPKEEVVDSGEETVDSAPNTDGSDDTGEASSDDTGEAPSDDSAEPEASPHRCYILAELPEMRVAVLDVDPYTGASQELAQFDMPTADYLGGVSLGKVGDVFVTTSGGYVMSFDLSTGQSAVLRESEARVTADGQTFALFDNQQEGTVTYYSTVEGIAGTRYDLAVRGDVRARSVALHDGRLYAAWHSATQIDVHSAETLELLTTIPLQDYDTWVQGVSVVGDVLFLADNGRSDYFEDQQPRIYRYDLETGQQLGVVVAEDFYPEGMWCEATE